MNKKEIIRETEKYLEKRLQGEGTGHDFWHVLRVAEMAKKIARKEGGDLFLVELAALLHEIADWKFAKKGKQTAAEKIDRLLQELKVNPEVINKVIEIENNISFKGAGVKDKMKSLEGKIVQDADRLDVLGAIGIARAFAYGGYLQREIYNPKIKPKLHKTFAEYKKSEGTSINHFYEKILLVRDRLNTKTAKIIADKRQKFTEKYLEQFFKEWKGKL